ncbi:MAG: Na(+)/H(+) antiporter subunit B [Desulfurivibrionaceae bacterium]|nr:Na(+)/H(+) antiporter subunit B [Desulfurivibrionaceae bacterium]
MMVNPGRKRLSPAHRPWPLLVLLLLFFVALVWVYLVPGSAPGGLARQVDASLAASGVRSRVTAVLLNFRGYDTLLECFILLLGVMVVWSQRSAVTTEPRQPAAGAILASLERLLLPLMILVAGYLLWAGSSQAGGAFQAGAILGGAGVLLLLDSSPFLGILPRKALVWGITLAPLFFLAVGVAALTLGRPFLTYRFQEASLVIVALEVAAAFSIGLCLATLFAGRLPGYQVGPSQGKPPAKRGE